MNNCWTDLIFEVDIKNAKKTEAFASQCTSLGIYIEDYSDMERMLPLIGRADYIADELSSKDRNCAAIHIYIPSGESYEEVISHMTELLESSDIKFAYRCESLNENDWANDWKKFHKAQRIGKRLVICPSWEEYDKSEDDILITIDPGTSFGTGEDETTRVCMRLLETYIQKEDKLLDMGCGSGVLSIAALLLGAESATGVDIDKNSVGASIENAQINHVADRFAGRWGNVLTDNLFKQELGGDYDLICANIMADVHLAMKEIYYNKLKDNGKLILSGIIHTRSDEVRSSFEQSGFGFLDLEEENGWIALGFKKL